jgi:hypothetical protein
MQRHTVVNETDGPVDGCIMKTGGPVYTADKWAGGWLSHADGCAGECGAMETDGPRKGEQRPSTGPSVYIAPHSLAHPCLLYIIHRPIRFHCPPFLGPSVCMGQPHRQIRLHCPPSSAHPSAWDDHPSARPSALLTMHRPIRLRCSPSTGPSVSIAHPSSAHPSPLPTPPRPIRLHCPPFLG